MSRHYLLHRWQGSREDRARNLSTRQGMSKESAARMMHTALSILNTVECTLLSDMSVTLMTLPPPVTTKRLFPSGNHATPRTCHDDMMLVRTKDIDHARTKRSFIVAVTFVRAAILVMRSELPKLAVATKVPSGDNTHTST